MTFSPFEPVGILMLITFACFGLVVFPYLIHLKGLFSTLSGLLLTTVVLAELSGILRAAILPLTMLVMAVGSRTKEVHLRINVWPSFLLFLFVDYLFVRALPLKSDVEVALFAKFSVMLLCGVVLSVLWSSLGPFQRHDFLVNLLKLSLFFVGTVLLISLVTQGSMNAPDLIDYSVEETYSLRLSAGFRHPNVLGQFAGLMLVTAICLVLFRQVSLFLGCLSSAVLLSALLLSGSRSSLVGATLALLGSILASQTGFVRRVKLLTIMGCLVSLLFLAVTFLQGEYSLTDRYFSPMASSGNVSGRIAETGRDVFWKGSLRTIQSNPLFGIGLFGLPEAIRKSGLSSVHAIWFSDTQPWAAHNLYLQYAATTGLVGLSILLSLGLLLLRDSIRLLKNKDPQLRCLGAIGLGITVMIATAGLGDDVIGPHWVGNLMIFSYYGMVRGAAWKIVEK